jgi:hypothetical protein
VSGFIWHGGMSDLTVTHDSEAVGEEVSVHCGEQERLVLDMDQWADLRTAAAMGAAGVLLLPAESMAITVARAQLERGDNPPLNTTAALLLTIDRLTGRETR